jgi:hypothetical protein
MKNMTIFCREQETGIVVFRPSSTKCIGILYNGLATIIYPKVTVEKKKLRGNTKYNNTE